jgi:hypothetical protein
MPENQPRVRGLKQGQYSDGSPNADAETISRPPRVCDAVWNRCQHFRGPLVGAWPTPSFKGSCLLQESS